MDEQTNIETTQVTTTDTPTPTPEQVDQAIDTAIDEAVAEVGGDKPKEGDKVEVEVEVEDRTKDSGQETKPGDTKNQEPKIDLGEEQALFERGIRAGLSMADLTAIPTHDAAEKIISMAEKAAGILPNKEAEDDGAGTPTDELGDALKEMESDGEYDPKILKLLKGLYNENQALKKAGQTAERNGFFESQFGSMDEGIRSHVDAVRLAKLKSKFDMLEAGYKAQGAQVSREDVFQEAAQLALGDLMNNAAAERKAAALEQRKNLTLARPGGENGLKPRRTGPATEEDIASEIWDEINK